MIKLERKGQLMIHSDTGGYFVNIDPAGNMVHKDSCFEHKNMDPEKNVGGIYHFEKYEEAETSLKENNIRYRDCDKCRPP